MNANYFNYKWQERKNREENDYCVRKINKSKNSVSGTYIELKLIKKDIIDNYLLLALLTRYFYREENYFRAACTFVYDIYTPDPLQQCLQRNQDNTTVVVKDNKVGIFIKNYKSPKSLFIGDKFLRVNKKEFKPDILSLQKEKSLSISLPEYSSSMRKIDYLGERFVAEKVYNYLSQH